MIYHTAFRRIKPEVTSSFYTVYCMVDCYSECYSSAVFVICFALFFTLMSSQSHNSCHEFKTTLHFDGSTNNRIYKMKTCTHSKWEIFVSLYTYCIDNTSNVTFQFAIFQYIYEKCIYIYVSIHVYLSIEHLNMNSWAFKYES